MKLPIPFCLLPLFVVIFLYTPVSAQGTDPLVANPEYQSWKRYKPGTTVYLKETVIRDGQTLVTFITTKLVSVDNDVAMVSLFYEPVVNGKRVKGVVQDRAIMSMLPKSQIDGVFNPPNKSEEGYMNLKINNRDYKCYWVQSNPGGDAVRVLWTHNQVPGLIARYFAKSQETGYQRDLQVLGFKLGR